MKTSNNPKALHPSYYARRRLTEASMAFLAAGVAIGCLASRLGHGLALNVIYGLSASWVAIAFWRIVRLNDLENAKEGQPQCAPKETPSDPSFEEKIRTILDDQLYNAYICGREWSAWAAGTMTNEDFTKFSDSPRFEELVSDILAAVSNEMIENNNHQTNEKNNQ